MVTRRRDMRKLAKITKEAEKAVDKICLANGKVDLLENICLASENVTYKATLRQRFTSKMAIRKAAKITKAGEKSQKKAKSVYKV